MVPPISNFILLENCPSFSEVIKFISRTGKRVDFDDVEAFQESGCVVYGEIQEVFPAVRLGNGKYHCAFQMKQVDHASQPAQAFRFLIELADPEPLQDLRIGSFFALLNPKRFIAYEQPTFSVGPDRIVAWLSKSPIPMRSKANQHSFFPGSGNSEVSSIKRFHTVRSRPVANAAAFSLQLGENNEDWHAMPPPSSNQINVNRRGKKPAQDWKNSSQKLQKSGKGLKTQSSNGYINLVEQESRERYTAGAPRSDELAPTFSLCSHRSAHGNHHSCLNGPNHHCCSFLEQHQGCCRAVSCSGRASSCCGNHQPQCEQSASPCRSHSCNYGKHFCNKSEVQPAIDKRSNRSTTNCCPPVISSCNVCPAHYSSFHQISNHSSECCLHHGVTRIPECTCRSSARPASPICHPIPLDKADITPSTSSPSKKLDPAPECLHGRRRNIFLPNEIPGPSNSNVWFVGSWVEHSRLMNVPRSRVRVHEDNFTDLQLPDSMDTKRASMGDSHQEQDWSPDEDDNFTSISQVVARNRPKQLLINSKRPKVIASSSKPAPIQDPAPVTEQELPPESDTSSSNESSLSDTSTLFLKHKLKTVPSRKRRPPQSGSVSSESPASKKSKPPEMVTIESSSEESDNVAEGIPISKNLKKDGNAGETVLNPSNDMNPAPPNTAAEGLSQETCKDDVLSCEISDSFLARLRTRPFAMSDKETQEESIIFDPEPKNQVEKRRKLYNKNDNTFYFDNNKPTAEDEVSAEINPSIRDKEMYTVPSNDEEVNRENLLNEETSNPRPQKKGNNLEEALLPDENHTARELDKNTIACTSKTGDKADKSDGESSEMDDDSRIEKRVLHVDCGDLNPIKQNSCSDLKKSYPLKASGLQKAATQGKPRLSQDSDIEGVLSSLGIKKHSDPKVYDQIGFPEVLGEDVAEVLIACSPAGANHPCDENTKKTAMEVYQDLTDDRMASKESNDSLSSADLPNDSSNAADRMSLPKHPDDKTHAAEISEKIDNLDDSCFLQQVGSSDLSLTMVGEDRDTIDMSVTSLDFNDDLSSLINHNSLSQLPTSTITAQLHQLPLTHTGAEMPSIMDVANVEIRVSPPQEANLTGTSTELDFDNCLSTQEKMDSNNLYNKSDSILSSDETPTNDQQILITVGAPKQRMPDSTTPEFLVAENIQSQDLIDSGSPARTVFYDAQELENYDGLEALKPGQLYRIECSIVNLEPTITDVSDIVKGICRTGCYQVFDLATVKQCPTVMKNCSLCKNLVHHLCPYCCQGSGIISLCLQFAFVAQVLIFTPLTCETSVIPLVPIVIANEEAEQFLGVSLQEYVQDQRKATNIIDKLKSLVPKDAQNNFFILIAKAWPCYGKLVLKLAKQKLSDLLNQNSYMGKLSLQP